ncbi:MAG: tRNA pseudouridine(38-40) synthase TruA [Candidatus Kapaibacterium sp.]
MKIALLIEYDGTDFAGWQIQPGVRTVQHELETAFERVLQKNIPLTAAGRTDAGVHALGMVAHAELPDSVTLPLEKLNDAVNATSGHDIVVRSMKEVASDFHARYSALDREYRYTIFRRRTALDRNFSWYVRGEIDLPVMNNAARHLLGDHDFTSFSKRSEDVEHYRCTLDKCEITVDEEIITIAIRANRFVRGMVRAIVGGLVEVGKGKMNEERFLQLLDTPTEADRAKYLAPAEGLIFWKVRYPKEFGLWE